MRTCVHPLSFLLRALGSSPSLHVALDSESGGITANAQSSLVRCLGGPPSLPSQWAQRPGAAIRYVPGKVIAARDVLRILFVQRVFIYEVGTYANNSERLACCSIPRVACVQRVTPLSRLDVPRSAPRTSTIASALVGPSGHLISLPRL